MIFFSLEVSEPSLFACLPVGIFLISAQFAIQTPLFFFITTSFHFVYLIYLQPTLYLPKFPSSISRNTCFALCDCI